jgi:NAD(P)-dependent dehydrogenase (short-subunit alcohol dehydrogenase family)
MDGKLEGKIAVVTGGTSGIGLATAKRFVAEGAVVFITGRRQAELDRAAEEIGPKAVAVRADSSSLTDLDRLYGRVKMEKGRSTFSLPMLALVSSPRWEKSPRSITTRRSTPT